MGVETRDTHENERDETMTTKTRLTCTGDTYSHRVALKDAGWKWDSSRQTWYTLIDSTDASRILAGEKDLLKGRGGQRVGCQLWIDGRVVWTSKTFQAASHVDQDGFGWNCDAHGNAVAGTRIPGSSPDDMV